VSPSTLRGKEGNMGYGRRGGERRAAVGAAMGTEVTVDEEVAYARARFAVDPSTPARLADAWNAPTGTTEEDESELIDAVADCLSVGLPLDAAVASWRSGSLQVSDREDDDDSDDEDDTSVFGDDDDTGVYDPRLTGRRRVIES
jgi:hypothetical protein